jgi:hypothetical protein
MSESRTPRLSRRPEAVSSVRAPLGEPSLRELARRELGGDLAASPASEVARAVIEVRLGERTELVTVARDGGRLQVSATDARPGEAMSPASRSALAWLADAEQDSSIEARTSLVPAAPRAGTQLGARLSDLAVAIVRSGVEVADPASVREALPRVVAELPAPPPLSVARWLGRLVSALAESDARQTARLLSSVTASGALGPPFVSEERSFSDRRFIELSRECLDAYGGAPIERRVLADEDSGELVIEERYVGTEGPVSSVGPCPRRLEVGLGVMRAGVPRRMRAQQYSVSSDISSDIWDRIEALACAMPIAISSALEALRAYPSDAEPVALLVAPSIEDGELCDGEGNKIPLSKEDVGAAERLVTEAQRERLRWVLVRWVARESGVAVVPLAAAHRVDGRWRHLRLR